LIGSVPDLVAAGLLSIGSAEALAVLDAKGNSGAAKPPQALKARQWL
jgi:hypothetical protein